MDLDLSLIYQLSSYWGLHGVIFSSQFWFSVTPPVENLHDEIFKSFSEGRNLVGPARLGSVEINPKSESQWVNTWRTLSRALVLSAPV